MAVFQNWKIANFSFWNKDVHGKCIKSPSLLFSSCKCMELYPAGISGLDEHLVVRFCDIQKDFSGGELSFIGSDESIICTLNVNRENNQNFLVSPLGPKYEDVIAQIGKEDEDQLTLQFVPSSGKDSEQRLCTIIDVLKIPLKINKNLGVKLDEVKNVLFISNESEEIYFKIAREEEKMHLVLVPHKEYFKPILVKVCIRLLNCKDDLVRYEESQHVFWSDDPWIFSDSLAFKEFVKEGNYLNICFEIVNGDIKKGCNHLLYTTKGVHITQNIHACDSEEKSSKGRNPLSNDATSNPTKSVSALAKELAYLYKEQDFSDLQLKCGTISFPVHKAILSSRSPVFKRMLSNDMREAGSGEVVIGDLDAPTLSRFLSFLYSGTVEDLEGESALKLYYAADKYEVPTLKRECVDFLMTNVSVSNVCDILSLGDRHLDDELLSSARDFILSNLNEVSRSEEWRVFMKSQPLLAVETMTHFTSKDLVTKKDIE